MHAARHIGAQVAQERHHAGRGAVVVLRAGVKPDALYRAAVELKPSAGEVAFGERAARVKAIAPEPERRLDARRLVAGWLRPARGRNRRSPRLPQSKPGLGKAIAGSRIQRCSVMLVTP
jgi:hypothetical protein